MKARSKRDKKTEPTLPVYTTTTVVLQRHGRRKARGRVTTSKYTITMDHSSYTVTAKQGNRTTRRVVCKDRVEAVREMVHIINQKIHKKNNSYEIVAEHWVEPLEKEWFDELVTKLPCQVPYASPSDILQTMSDPQIDWLDYKERIDTIEL